MSVAHVFKQMRGISVILATEKVNIWTYLFRYRIVTKD